MNFIKKSILIVSLVLLVFVWLNFKEISARNNVEIIGVDKWDKNRNVELKKFWENKKEFFGLWNIQWGQGIYYVIVNIAYSLKNIIFLFATIFYIVIAIKLLVSQNTEEQVTKFKKGIIWITIWLMVMQMAYAFSLTLYAKHVWQKLAFDLISNIVNPLIWLMEVLASIFFIAIAIFAFYRMVTANGNDEEVKRAKMSIVYAIMWFILIKLASVIVSWVYGSLSCEQISIGWFDVATASCIWSADVKWLSFTIMQIINWANSFLGIITILLIIYAWFNILFSGWEEEKIKKGKNTIIYIFVWLLLLSINYLILTFFIKPETVI